MIVAQMAKDESESVEGPFRSTDDNIDRIVSVISEKSKSSFWRMTVIKLQAALDVT